MGKIQYENKVALLENADIPDINKITDDDMNEIKQVVNENDDKFLTNGLNVSNEVDEDYRVNFLKSKNLFNANNVLNGMGIASGGTITSATDNGLFYIPVVVGKIYVFSFTDNGVSGNIVWGYTSQVPANGVSCTYNVMANASLNGAIFTPTGTQKYLCIRLNTTSNNQYNAMSNIQCEEGSTATSFEPYITPSINVDGEEIYSKGKYHTYSTSEKVVGTWINGKTLYEKTFVDTLPNSSSGGTTGSKTIAHNISNVETIFIEDAFVDNIYETFPMPFITSAGYRIWCNPSTTNIYLYNQQPTMNGVSVKITVRYTKSTDTVSTRSIPIEEPEENSR